MVGLEGPTLDSEARRLVADYPLGGIVFFSRNVEGPRQLARLVRDIQAAAAAPMLMAIDHEGGRVQRLPAPFTRLPAMVDFGRAGAPELSRRLGRLAARELRAVGVHLNLAPVVDVVTHPDNQVIGDRSFGSDPLLVGELGGVFIEAHQGEGVAACAKHFPGHGATATDSHQALPRDERPLEAFRALDLPPFRRAIAARVACVMTAHVECPRVDDHPATHSVRWIEGILRGELGFPGAVLSDDLEMKALGARYSVAESAFLAVRAGCDFVLAASGSAARHREWMDAFLDLARNIPAAEVARGNERAQVLRNRWAASSAPDPDAAAASVPCPEGPRLLDDLARALDGV
jgi:beta-N-acetylhexosaminidase